MLECILIVLDVIVEVVRIGEELGALREHVARADIGLREVDALRVLNDEEVTGVVAEVSAELVAKVGVGVAFAYNLYWFVDTYRPMVGSHDNVKITG